jgi:superoxide dismutase, Fe-Mn family
MRITLPKLPYPDDALEPHISRTTLQVHHGQHHRVYVENVRTLAKQVRLADRPLEHILRQTAGQDGHRALFNNAAQAWNHAVYWRSLKPNGGGVPVGEIAKRIDSDFGAYARFAEQFRAAAVGQFGSGWAWLVLDGNTLKVTRTTACPWANPAAHDRRVGACLLSRLPESSRRLCRRGHQVSSQLGFRQSQLEPSERAAERSGAPRGTSWGELIAWRPSRLGRRPAAYRSFTRMAARGLFDQSQGHRHDVHRAVHLRRSGRQPSVGRDAGRACLG